MGADIGALDNPGPILAQSVLFGVLFVSAVYAMGLGFICILSFLSRRKLSLAEPLELYTKANLCKYLPGNVMHFIARNLYAQKIGMSQGQMALGSLLEIGFAAAVACILCLLLARELFFVLAGEYIRWQLYLIAGLVLLLAAGIALWFLAKTKRLAKWIEEIKEYKLTPMLFVKLSLKLTGLMAYFHLFAGLLFFILLQQVAPEAEVSLTRVLPAYIIAWLLGYITPGAPGGMGVKEAILTLLLGDVYGRGVVLIAALLFRLTTVIADVLAFGFVFAYRAFTHKRISE